MITDEGIRSLDSAVMRQAIIDMRSFRQPFYAGRQYGTEAFNSFARAAEWVFSAELAGLKSHFGFREICDRLGLCSKTVRQEIWNRLDTEHHKHINALGIEAVQ